MSKNSSAKSATLNIPDTATWHVKGDGVAYTTAREILNSKAGRRQINETAKVALNKRG